MMMQSLPDLIDHEVASRIHLPSQVPFEKVFYVGIAIQRHSDTHFHAGMLYRDHISGKCFLLHVPGDMSLQNEPPDESYAWVSPELHPLRAPQVAAWCRLVRDANIANGVPYGFSDPRKCFDQVSGKFLKDNGKVGLTCSSFVLAVFDLAGLPLIEYDSWENRLDDNECFNRYADMIQRNSDSWKLSDDFVEQMRAEIGNYRYRPTEVAGAGMAIKPNGSPISFKDAVNLGEYVVHFTKLSQNRATA